MEITSASSLPPQCMHGLDTRGTPRRIPVHYRASNGDKDGSKRGPLRNGAVRRAGQASWLNELLSPPVRLETAVTRFHFAVIESPHLDSEPVYSSKPQGGIYARSRRRIVYAEGVLCLVLEIKPIANRSVTLIIRSLCPPAPSPRQMECCRRLALTIPDI